MHRKDGSVVLFDIRAEKFPHFDVWDRTVDVATPDPLALMSRVFEMPNRCGLRIVHNKNVVVFIQHFGAQLIVFEINLSGLLSKVQISALKGIVLALRNREELLVAIDYSPLRRKAQCDVDWNDSAE